MRTFTPNDKAWYTGPGRAPIRKPRRRKIPPAKALPCRVKNSKGIYYGYDDLRRTLGESFVSASAPLSAMGEGYIFSSRRKASAAVWRTIQRWKGNGETWKGKEFILENA